MPLVLAIEPDHRQATILKRIVRERVHAEFVLVDSRDAAVSAIAARIPEVILVTTLLSPRDEEELVTYLRTLEGAEHLQTYTIPLLASTAADAEQKNGGGLFGKFRRKKDSEQTIPGCDPDHFAQEIVTFLERAADRRRESAATLQQRAAHEEFKSRRVESSTAPTEPTPAATPDPEQPSDSAWASPFEWRPASERAANAPPEAAQAKSSMVTNVPLAVVAEDQEALAVREREAELERLAAEAAERQQRDAEERERLEAEARARHEEEQRRQKDERRRADEDSKRREAEAATKRRREEEERKRLEAEAAAKRKREEEERKRLEAEAAVRRKREEEERKRREEQERKRLEAEAAAKRKREEEERRRLEAEAAVRRKREEEERKRLEAEAAARKKREEEERKRLEAEAAARRKREEEERRRREEERKKREEEERRRLEAEAAARRKREEEERRRREEEERKKREEEERKRLEAEAAARRKREEEEARRREEEAAARRREEEAARRREEEEARRIEAERQRQEEERQREIAAAAADPFREFRADHDEPSGILRLIPVSSWARPERPKPAGDQDLAPKDEFLQLLSGLRIPQHVAVISYPRGCRIRRVRVRALDQPAATSDRKKTLIVSKKALQQSRRSADR